MEEWRQMAERVRNWGRWGDGDQLGTLNHIGPETIARAASLVRKGIAIPMSIPLDANGPQSGRGWRRNPLHIMTVVGASDRLYAHLEDVDEVTAQEMRGLVEAGPMRFNDDFITMHLQASTQWDALGHTYYDELLYNGYPADAVNVFGATKVGIEHVARAGRIVARGVLLDVARFRGVEHLSSEASIAPAELDEVAESQGVEIEPGDVVLIRTAWWTQFDGDGDTWRSQSPGVNWRCAEWLHSKSAAAVASDNLAVESHVQDAGVPFAFHMIAIRDMGMMLGEMWDLEALGEDCADDGQYAFQLVAQPLNVTGAVGSPITPLAIK